MQKYIYIVFIKSMTGVSKITRKIVPYDYTHISISFDESLTHFVTFARRTLYTPLDAGIVHECRSNYAFEGMKDFQTKIFQLPVSDSELEAIQEMINECETDPEYMFNLFSMVTMPIFHGFTVYKTHNCMSFASKIISMTSCVKMERPYYKYFPSELDELMKDYIYYEGRLPKDDAVIACFEQTPPGHFKMLGVNIKILGRLLYRCIRYPVAH